MAGLLGAATVNPLMARQFANARQNVTAPTSVMDERYPAWKKSQDQADQFLLAADLIGSAVPAGLLAAPAMKKGLLSMGETVAPKMEKYMARQGLLQPITAYQGSPHKYDPEKLVRLANGETAYVGGKFNALKEPPPGSTVLEDFPLGRIRSEAIGTGEGKQQQGVGSYFAESKEVSQKYADKEAWKRGMDSGYLYKVDIPDEMISLMANHDLPLRKQPQSVKDAASGLLNENAKKALKDYHGWENVNDAPFAALMDALEIAKGNNRSATSEILRQAGIPGIRYLDGGSRGAGAGTSNFVVFPGNEQLVKILSRE